LRRLWSGSSINKNKELVEHLKASKKVAEVLESIDRALFVPDGNAPYYDTPIPIGYNATISAPHMHATSLQLLEENLQPGMHALDVGSGVVLKPSGLIYSNIHVLILPMSFLLSSIVLQSCII
jgi:protein-L-isoaspartate(D-aspartate) O-methyltransferase